MGRRRATKDARLGRRNGPESMHYAGATEIRPFLMGFCDETLHLLKGHGFVGLKLQASCFSPVGPLACGTGKQSHASSARRTQKSMCGSSIKRAMLKSHPDPISSGFLRVHWVG